MVKGFGGGGMTQLAIITLRKIGKDSGHGFADGCAEWLKIFDDLGGCSYEKR
jgi:hypothetical protein